MNAKDIIELNNELREQLNKENLAAYEDMLTYIRLSSNKSEQQTEEVLLELLEHLLEAQKSGKTAKDIFGEDLKQYCDELINEIPGEKMTKNMRFWSYIALQYLAVITLTFGLLSFLLHSFFQLGESSLRFPLGTGVIAILLDLGLFYLLVRFILAWMKNSSFKEKRPKKWVEFLQLWLIMTCAIALFYFIPKLLPHFGTTITLHNLVIAAIGVILYLIAKILNKRYRFTS